MWSLGAREKWAYTFYNDTFKIYYIINLCAVTVYMALKVKNVKIIELINDWSDLKPLSWAHF